MLLLHRYDELDGFRKTDIRYFDKLLLYLNTCNIVIGRYYDCEVERSKGNIRYNIIYYMRST